MKTLDEMEKELRQVVIDTMPIRWGFITYSNRLEPREYVLEAISAYFASLRAAESGPGEKVTSQLGET